MRKIIKIKESSLKRAIRESASEMKEMARITTQFSDTEWHPIVEKPEPAYKIYVENKLQSVINIITDKNIGTEGSRAVDKTFIRNIAKLLKDYKPEEIKILVPTEEDVQMVKSLWTNKHFIDYVRKFGDPKYLDDPSVKRDFSGLQQGDSETYIRRNTDVIQLKRIGVAVDQDYSDRGGNIIGQIHTQYILDGAHYRLNDEDLIPEAISNGLKPTVTALFYLLGGISPEEYIEKHRKVIEETQEIAEIIYFIPANEIPKFREQSEKYGYEMGGSDKVQATKKPSKKMKMEVSEEIRRKTFPYIEKYMESPELVDFFLKNVIPPIIFEPKYRTSPSTSAAETSFITTRAANFLSFNSNKNYYNKVKEFTNKLRNNEKESFSLISRNTDPKEAISKWREQFRENWQSAENEGIAKSYHMPRQHTTAYQKWSDTRKNIQTPTARKTPIYKLDQGGFVPENLDVTLKSEFILQGNLNEDSTWTWKAVYTLSQGRKSENEERIEKMFPAIDPIIEYVTTDKIDPRKILNEEDVWRSLNEVLSIIKREILSTSDENFSLGKILSYYDSSIAQKDNVGQEEDQLAGLLNEENINKITNKIMKEIYEESNKAKRKGSL